MQSLCNGLMPIMARQPFWPTIHPLDRALLALAEPTRKEFEIRAAENPDQELPVAGPLLLSVGNGFTPYYSGWKFRAHADYSMVFIEDTFLDAAVLDKAKHYKKHITGSTWNQTLLHEHGIENTAV